MQIGVESSRAVDNKRVFVVEGDEIVRAALQFMLHDESETHEIPSVADAYRKAAEWRPDAVLLGLGLVREHGADLIGEMKARIPGVRIAVVADSLSDALAADCLRRGAQTVVAKPFTIESVRRKVDILLGRRASLGIQVHVS